METLRSAVRDACNFGRTGNAQRPVKSPRQSRPYTERSVNPGQLAWSLGKQELRLRAVKSGHARDCGLKMSSFCQTTIIGVGNMECTRCDLDAEALAAAQEVEFEIDETVGSVRTRILRAEHVVATLLRVGRPRDFIRISQFLEEDATEARSTSAHHVRR